MPSICYCKSSPPIRATQASAFGVLWLILCESARTGGGIIAIFTKYVNFNSFSLRDSKNVCGSFGSLALMGAANRRSQVLNIKIRGIIQKTSGVFWCLMVLSIRL